MTYNFTDDPTPSLKTQIDPSGTAVVLADGSPQGDFLTAKFAGQTVAVSIVPPEGWVLDQVQWDDKGGGVFSVPKEGEEKTYGFTYTVSLAGSVGSSLSDGGSFKIKKAGGPG